MSWFPCLYEQFRSFWSRVGNKSALAPLQRLPTDSAGLDLSVWCAIVLVRFRGEPSAFSVDDRMNIKGFMHFSPEDRPFLVTREWNG